VGEGSGSLDMFLKTTTPYNCWQGLWRHSGGDALSREVETGVKDCVMRVKNISNKNIYVV
jgi:hypothetical protein